MSVASACCDGDVVFGIYGTGASTCLSSRRGLTLKVTFVREYVEWNIDNVFCADLRASGDVFGMPLGFVSAEYR